MGKAWPALDIHVPACDSQLQELVLAELDDFQPSAIHEPDDSSRLRVFFGSPDLRNAAARALASAFGSHLFVEAIAVEDEDWAARAQSDLRAVTVGRLVIAPPWDVLPGSDPGTVRGSDPGESAAKVIVIRPSMGFGTGHHATTRLMLKALQSTPVENHTVLDVGCGSGVLAIAAVRLGAHSALGVDIDSDALANAAENLELNAMANRVRLQEKDFREMSSSFGVVLANLTGGLLEPSASKLAALVEPGGHLIVSGFMQSEARVVASLEKFLSLQKAEQEDEWMCATLQRPAL